MKQKYPAYLLLLFVILIASTPARADRTIVKMQTNYGDIYINLFNDEAPITVENFLSYVDRGFYDGLIFHRVVNSDSYSIIQTGAYNPNLYDADFTRTDDDFITDPNFYHEPNDPIVLEVDAEIEHERGTIAMARQSGNNNSATSQFFINVEDNTSAWDADEYAVFGEVIDGMDTADSIVEVEVEEKHSSFASLPVEPVMVESVSVYREFDPNSADFSDVPFLGAYGGLIRHFAGQGEFATSEFRQEFAEEQLLGVTCLKWTQSTSTDDEVGSFSIYLARDTDGGMWILKYVTDEDTDDETVVIEAEDLFDAVSFTEFALDNLYFRLITGGYNPDDIEDASNIVSNGFGDSKETEQIVSVTESLPPGWPDENLVLVKWTKGPVDSPGDIKWRYYDPNEGLVLDLWDDGQVLDGDGWRCSELLFDDTCDDFSEVPFIGATAGTTRTFIGQGAYAQSTYTHTFTAGEEPFQGIDYLVWRQSSLDWDTDATPIENDIVEFSLRLAKDTDGVIWIFEYTRDGETIFQADYLYEARRLSEFDEDDMLFRLITSGHNPDNLEDPVNTITVTSGDDTRTEKITRFTETIDHIPHYQGELVEVNKWLGDTENDNDISYYHDSVGMVLNLRNGQTGSDGDGWHLAYFGATFDNTNSYDLTDIPYLNAYSILLRNFIGQGDLTDPNGVAYFTHKFSQRTDNGILCLRWRIYPSDNAEDDITGDYIDIARDSLDTVWVLKYYRNSKTVFAADSAIDARLLSDFADENMHYRLITGLYNAENLSAAENTISYTLDDDTITEQIVGFNETVDFMPYYEDDLVLVKITRSSDSNDIRWQYYHTQAGVVLELRDEDTQPTPALTLNGWRLGWYGENEPDFGSDSYNFEDTPYISALPGQIKIYRGQGNFDGYTYRQFFAMEQCFGVNCLKITESAVAAQNKPATELLVARDGDDALWLFKAVSGSDTLFEAQALDQIAPFLWVPDILFQLAAGNDQVDAEVSTGEGEALQTQQIVRDEQSLDDYDDYEDYQDEMFLIKTTLGEAAADVRWSWYHESTGLLLDLWDNFTDPDLDEPNINEPNDLAPDQADGWFLAVPDELKDLTISLKAGTTRHTVKDAFKLEGKLALQADDFENGQLFFINIGPWSAELNTNSFTFSKNQITYRGSPDGGGYLVIRFNLKKETFTIAATKVDLTGLQDPISVAIQIGDIYVSGTAEVKGGKNSPIRLLQGQDDKIQIKNFVYVAHSSASDPGYYYHQLKIMGEIATKTYPLDLSELDTTISWGSTDFTISAEKFRQVGKQQKFIYSTPSNELQYTRFDLDKGTFTIKIRKYNLSKPTQTLKILFKNEDGDTVFNEQISVQTP